MPSAQKARAKKDAKIARETRASDAAPHNPTQHPPQLPPQHPIKQPRPAGFDGPAESSSGAPPSRGRPESSRAPSVGQPIRGQSPRRGPSQGPSQGRTSSQERGTSSRMLPDRDEVLKARRFAARFVDLPANAYTIGGGLGEVSKDLGAGLLVEFHQTCRSKLSSQSTSSISHSHCSRVTTSSTPQFLGFSTFLHFMNCEIVSSLGVFTAGLATKLPT